MIVSSNAAAIKVTLWLGLICLVSSSISEGAQTQPSIAVRAAVETGAPEPLSLKVSIANAGDQSINLFRADLPWGTRHALLLIPITLDQTAKRLDESLYVDDPSPGTITLSPSQESSGHIDLRRRFPGLSATLERTDIILFWSYQCELLDGTKTNRVSGAIVISRTSHK